MTVSFLLDRQAINRKTPGGHDWRRPGGPYPDLGVNALGRTAVRPRNYTKLEKRPLAFGDRVLRGTAAGCWSA